MKAIVTSASQLDKDFNQEVKFNIVHGEGDPVLLTHTIKAHVDNVRNDVQQFTQEWGAKYLESIRVQEGEVIGD